MSMIEDGKGTGKRAEVLEDNSLSVTSVTSNKIAKISNDFAKSYDFHFKRVIAAASTVEQVAYLEYNGDQRLFVESITMSREDVNLSSGSQALVEVISKPVYTSGGDSITPVNINLGSSNTVLATAYSGTTTLVIDQSNAKKIFDSVVENSNIVSTSGALILTKGDAISVRVKSKNIGDAIHCIILAYEGEE